METKYPIKIAIAGGVGLALLEITVEKLLLKHVHKLSQFNFFLLLFLGALSFLGEEGLWFKLQPFFTGQILGGVLIYHLLKGKGLMFEMMESMGKAEIPEPLFRMLEWHMTILLMAYGVFMGSLAIWAETSTWAFFKTIGFYIVFAIFMLVEMLLMRRKLRQMAEFEAKRRVLKKR